MAVIRIVSNSFDTATNQQTPCSRVLFQKLRVSQLVGKFPVFYETKAFITGFTGSHSLPLPSATCIRKKPSYLLFKINSSIVFPSASKNIYIYI